ncbi:hypothetical protein JXM67_10175 [candidate division WOR-3 bacterium]|nr:hypothetical protein [candidate division WOR-3 bacterium]
MIKKVKVFLLGISICLLLIGLSCDDKPPTVNITNIEDGDFVEGQVTITVEAQDDKAIDLVYFHIDDVLATTDGEEPYEYVWDASGLERGSSHIIKVVAYDRAGNEGKQAITVRIGAEDVKPPIVTINHPTDGGSVGGKFGICVEAIDNIKVENVIFYIDEVLVFDDKAFPYEYLWNTAGLEHGTQHTIDVYAYDPTGNEGKDQVTVTIDIENPTVSIMEPDDGARVWGIVTILVDAADNDEIVYVDFYIDQSSEPVYADGEAPYRYEWNTGGLTPESTHTINVVAYDEAGNEAQDEISVTVGQ